MPILFALAVIALVAVLLIQARQRTIGVWTAVANQLGLDISIPGRFSRPTITGTLNGLPVRIDTYVTRSGNNSTTHTRYQVRYPSPGFSFELKREGGLSSFIGKFLGIKDTQVGDPLFDGAFKVKTSNQQRLAAFLTPSVRSGLYRLMASYPNAVITEDHIGMTRAKFESDFNRLSSSIQRLVATAQLLTSPTAGVSDENVIDREQGLLSDVAERIRQAVADHPEDIDQRIFEVETLAAAGDDRKAAERVGELERVAPADPDVAGWREALTAPTAPAPTGDIDVDEMAEELFGGNDLSFETRTKFNNRYAGATVRCEGRVKRVRPIGPTATVTVTVATVNNDLYGNTEIDVLAEVASSSAPEVESIVTVAGMLVRIDPLVRNIYVENATIS